MHKISKCMYLFIFNIRFQTMSWDGEGVIGVVTVAYNSGHLYNWKESEDVEFKY